MAEQACTRCGLSALCLGAGGSLEELIARMVTTYIDKFIAAGPDAQTEYEQDAIQNVAMKLASKRVLALLEQRLPPECPMLRRHDANSEGVAVEWHGDGDD